MKRKIVRNLHGLDVVVVLHLVASGLPAMLASSEDGETHSITRLPIYRQISLSTVGQRQAVILVPDEPEYEELGQDLSEAIRARTGIRLEVGSAAEYVEREPRAVKNKKLDRDFILLGQFWKRGYPLGSSNPNM